MNRAADRTLPLLNPPLERQSVRWAAAGLIVGLVLVVYFPALRGGFVWDDGAHVTRLDLQSWTGLARIWSDPSATQQYYPVLHTAFWIEHQLWGDAVLGYHVVNLLQHAAACLLLVAVLQRLWKPGRKNARENHGRSAVPAGTEWLAAMLFAVHPVNVESVAWISEQKNTLSLVFYLVAAWFFLDFEAQRRKSSYAWATGFFLLALGTKTVTATLPAALLVALWWKNGRLQFRRDVAPLAPWFILSTLAGAITAWVEQALIGAQGADYHLSGTEHVLLAGRVVWFYLGKLIWPANLIFIYPRWDVPAAAGSWSLALAGVAVVTLALWLLRQRTRGPLAAWLFFVGSLFPALGFFHVYPFIFSYVADHFQYLASLGMIVAAAVGISARLVQSPAKWRATGFGFVAVLVGGLALLANRQSQVYRDAVTLYRVTLERNPTSWLAHNNLAVEIENLPGQADEALAHYTEAERLRPDNVEIRNNRGDLLLTLGRPAEAETEFAIAVRLDPKFLPARVNLANTLALDPRRLTETLDVFAAAIRQDPDNAATHFSLANALATEAGHETEALAEFAAAVRLRPDYADAEAGRAELFARMPGRAAEAETHFIIALRLAPNRAKTHYNYALWLETVAGRESEVLAQFETAVRLDPAYVQAHNNLAVCLAQRGQFDLARAHWETALRLKPGFEDAIRNLELLKKTGH